MRHYVHFTKEAIAQILLNGFEAYVIKHNGKKRSGIEMFASLYGTKGKETATTKHFYVKFVSVDTSAVMQSGQVDNDVNALAMKRDLAGAMDFKQFGTIHSHPYLPAEMGLKEVRERGCKFSDTDLCIIKNDLNTNLDHFLQVVLTIRMQDRQDFKCDGAMGENIFEFSVAGCKCFLNAQIFSLNSEKELVSERSILKCEHLERFDYIAYSGKVEREKGKKRILVHK